ncbi:MAG: glycosyltransferase family 4 protein [Anaerolineae bacterium]|jgi:glycosyltransferase involved in cell wall biosynthesis|nr:glycosyltransferase family 4 protein [Anaerolineae bacterium]
MHIALNGWFWDQPNTGSGQYLRRLLPALHKQEATLQTTLIVPAHVPPPAGLPPGVQVLPVGPARVAGGLRARLHKVWFEQRLFPQAVARCGAHLAHVPYWGAPLSSPVPLVTSVLDVIPLVYPVYSLGFFNRLYTTLVSTSARGSNHLITISETAKLDIEYWLNLPPDGITVTYLAPDEVYHPLIGRERDAAVREKYHLPEKYVLAGFGFDVRKRLTDALLAYTYVSDAQGVEVPLVIAGRVPPPQPPLFPDVREYARALEVEEAVQWIGYVEEADKPALYRMAELFVFTSEYEGFGLPPLEAMASGTPVVALDTVINDEILGDGAYLVPDARRMAGAIIALLIQPPLHEAMTNQGLAQATRYSWRKTARQTLAVYEKVLAGPR